MNLVQQVWFNKQSFVDSLTRTVRELKGQLDATDENDPGHLKVQAQLRRAEEELVQAKLDLAEVQSRLDKTEQHLNVAEQLLEDVTKLGAFRP
jgi:hypothetical protein